MGKNCIVSIVSKGTEELPVLTAADLQAASFTFNSRFQINLIDSQPLSVDRVARILPGKRMAVFGRWQGKDVVAKLFFDPINAKRHAARDALGITSLVANKIPTPELYYQGLGEDQAISVLIFEEIKYADNLGEMWDSRQDDEELFLLLQTVVVEIATQHVFGILQHDVHLYNFLINDQSVYTLDGGQIQSEEHLLSKKVSMDNLALFLSQFGVGVERLQEKLFRYYARVRGWRIKKDDILEIFEQIKRWQRVRWQHFSKKIMRKSTQFNTIKNWRAFGVYDRRLTSPALTALLQNPENFFNQPDITLLKAGRSATVIRLTLDGKDYVVKRYNLKSSVHWLRRSIRPSRAAKSWRLAHKLKLFGLATANPVAFLETRFAGLRGKSYFISEYVKGEDIHHYFSSHLMSQDKVEALISRTIQLLRGVRKLDMSHGDLKASNIIIDQHHKPVLIDLDGAVEHTSKVSLRKAWVHEMKRFLRNFDDIANIKQQLESELKK